MEESKNALWITLVLVFLGILLLSGAFAMKSDNSEKSQTGSSQVVQTSRIYLNCGHDCPDGEQFYVLPPWFSSDPVKVSYSRNDNYNYRYNQNPYYYNYNNQNYNYNYNQNYLYNYNGVYQSRKMVSTYSPVRYTQYATQETRKDFIGSYVKEYSTYVINRGNTGRYFTVDFTLRDKNGYVFTQSVTQYLRTGEQKKFVYRDIQFERNEILDWSYKITPQNY